MHEFNNASLSNEQTIIPINVAHGKQYTKAISKHNFQMCWLLFHYLA